MKLLGARQPETQLLSPFPPLSREEVEKARDRGWELVVRLRVPSMASKEEYEMVNVRNKSYMRTVVERTQENDTIAVMFQIKKSKIRREKKKSN